MERVIYNSETILRSFDLAWALKDVMASVGYLENDLAGSTLTVVSGFGAAPTLPASLTINLAAGRIYQNSVTDGSSFSTLAADATLIQQQGIAPAQSVTLLTTALSGGQSQWALIQAQFSQADAVRTGDPTSGVEQYFNTNNPTQPFQGPNNDGEPGPTVRRGLVALQVLLGVPATTGSEVPPTVSLGWTPLYLVDLAFGQSAITAGEILVAGPSVGTNVPSNYPAAPFMAGLLNSHHGGGPGAAPKIRMAELASASSSNTNGGIATTYSSSGNPNGLVAGNAATSTLPPDICVDTTHNILYFCTTTGNAATAVWNPVSGQSVSFVGGVSTGTANAQVVTSVTPSGFAMVNGYSVTFSPGLTNTGATTFAAGGFAATACRKVSGGALVAFTGNEFIATQPATVIFNGTFWVLQTSVLGALAQLGIGQWLRNDGANNLTIKNGALLGDDGSGNINLLNTAVTPGTYTNPTMTVSATGQVTNIAGGIDFFGNSFFLGMM